MSKDVVGAPVGAEPSAAFNNARRKAADLLTLAAHPKLLPVGSNMCTEDWRTADREAQMGLAWAMVYLADALNSGAASSRGDEA